MSLDARSIWRKSLETTDFELVHRFNICVLRLAARNNEFTYSLFSAIMFVVLVILDVFFLCLCMVKLQQLCFPLSPLFVCMFMPFLTRISIRLVFTLSVINSFYSFFCSLFTCVCLSFNQMLDAKSVSDLWFFSSIFFFF